MEYLKKCLGHFWLAYPMLVLKVFVFYWQTDMLDMMNVYEAPALTLLFLLFIFEVFSFKESRIRRYGFYFVYTCITIVMFADAAYSGYFGQYASVNQLYQLSSLGQIAGDGNVLGAALHPLCVLCLLDLPFVFYWYRIRCKGKQGMIDGLAEALTLEQDTRKKKVQPEKESQKKEIQPDSESRKMSVQSDDELSKLDKTSKDKTQDKGESRKKYDQKNILKKGTLVAAHIIFYVFVVCAWYYYGFNPQDLRSVQKVNHIEFFTYHTNDILVNVVGRLERGDVNEQEILQTMKETVTASSGEDYKGVAKGKNLILIQTESLNDFVIGAEYNGQEITPNLNALLKKDTFYFNHFYSTTGVGNTCDAEFSALNSLYPNNVRECYRMYVDNTYNGLPWMLRQEGYESLAFHGYIKTFWNRNEAYKNQGFEHFYSEEELDMTQKSGFGLTDKELFRQAVDILHKKEKPFFSFMITLTNHIPYELDPSLATLELKNSDVGSTFGNYLQTVRYTDEAFGELIQYLKENDMYENTMIVIYGDHQGMNMETPAVKYKMSQFLGKEYDYDEMLSVPLIIHVPGLMESKTVDTVGGEVDIMPTIANLMDLDAGQPYVFGQDLLNADEGFIAQISYVGEGSFITNENNMLFTIGKDGTVGSGRVLSILNGQQQNLSEPICEKYSDRAQTLLDTCMEVLDDNLIANYVTH